MTHVVKCICVSHKSGGEKQQQNCEGYSLQWFIQHAASPKARFVQQHLTEVSHLSIHWTLITGK